MLNPSTQFPNLLDNVRKAVEKTFPIQTPSYRMEVKNLRYTNISDTASVSKYLMSKRKEGNHTVSLVGDVTLVDSAGKVVDTKRNKIIAIVPAVTKMGTFMLNGKDIQIINQVRRRPGVYTAHQNDGDVSAKLSTAGGEYRIIVDRKKRRMQIKIRSRHFSLYSFLDILGATEAQQRDALGPFYAQSKSEAKPDIDVITIRGLLRQVAPKPGADLRQEIVEFFDSKPVDPGVTKQTLGEEYKSINLPLIIASAKKARAVNSGEVESDDMEAMSFKTIHSVDDFIKERLEKLRPQLQGRLKYMMNRTGQIEKSLTPDVFSNPILGFFTQSSLTRYSGQMSPLSVLSNNLTTTVMGEGGIQSDRAISDSLRAVHPSHLGVYDPTHTSECFDSETEVMTDQGWVKWPDVTEDTVFACQIDGHLEYHKADGLVVRDYEGLMYGARSQQTEYLVTPNHRIWCRPTDQGSRFRFELAEESHNRSRNVMSGGHKAYLGEDIQEFRLSEPPGGNATKFFEQPFEIGDWAEFLGWYLSEGSTYLSYGKGCVKISQDREYNPAKCSRIEALLDSLNMRWSYSGKTGDFSIPRMQLAKYTKQFGTCEEKFIPEEAFSWPIEARERLLEALMLGDGTIDRRHGNVRSYTTTSPQLAKDVERLCFGLGISVRITQHSDDRKASYLNTYLVHMHVAQERTFRKQMRSVYSGYFTEEYSGKVYCAKVPGGLLYCRRNHKGGHWSGNSSSIGVINHLAMGAKKVGNQLVINVIDARTGQRKDVSTVELGSKVLAFNDAWKNNQVVGDSRGKVSAIVDGKTQTMVTPREVDYILPDASNMFSAVSAQIPFIHNNSANRILMAGRHMEQTSPLVDPDKPLVMAAVNGKPMNKILHDTFNEKCPADGVVEKVQKGKITIRGVDGGQHIVEYHSMYPYNEETWLKQTPTVRAGDRVKKGQILTTDNFSKDNVYATGKNLRTAMMPFKGLTFEDAFVISEGAAKKLTSEHKYELRLEKGPGVRPGFAAISSLNVSGLGKPQNFKGDLPKIGSIFEDGDIVIPAAMERHVDPTSAEARASSKLRNPFIDASVRWDEPYPGKVVDVVQTSRFVKVYIETQEAARVGDKASTRAGSKGIISRIIPDDEMPKDSQGRPFEAIFSPFGLPGRVNPGFMFEAAAGKIAQKTGKPYLVNNFSPESSVDVLQNELKKHNLSDTETVFDPTTGQTHEDVGAGDIHWLKLKHSVHHKWSARSNDGYTREERPAKGRPVSAQSVGPLELYSMLANGSTEFVKDVSRLTSNKNDAYWTAFQLGQPTPPPETPFVLEKFKNYMMGAGINVEQEGNKIKATPFTDEDVLAKSSGEIKSPFTIRAKDLEPEKGGLFDKELTGGYNGTNINHITLSEKLPHPLYERPIASILGLTATQYNKIVSGDMSVKDLKLDASGPEGELTGGPAIEYLLSKVNVPNEINKIRNALPTATKTSKPKMLTKLRYLSSLSKMKMKPGDAYMMKHLPVIPPKFRPVYNNAEGQLVVGDPNHAYREVMLVNDQMKNLKNLGVDDTNIKPLRKGIYSAVSATIGLSEPLTRGREFKGFISAIAGKRNKTGLFQGKLLHRPVDLSGRSTLIPNPELGMDEMGLPKKIAFKTYEPFIIRRLVGAGMDPLTAKDQVKNRTEPALKALQEEMKTRPVILNRAPTLHKFSAVSFKPRLTDGLAMEANALIVGGFNMDFDGDTAAVHVPVSEKARKEALKNLPSKNFMGHRTRTVEHKPAKEMYLGIYKITKPVRPTNITVKHGAEALKLLRDRKIRINDRISYRGKPVTAGAFLVRGIFPKDIEYDMYQPLTAKKVSGLIEEVAKEHPEMLGSVVNQIKDIGNTYVTELGFSVSLKDLKFKDNQRKRILRKMVRDMTRLGYHDAFQRGIKELNDLMKVNTEGNRFVEMGTESEAMAGKRDNIRQMILAPVAYNDHKGQMVPMPVDRSFAEGLKPDQYFASFAPSRAGVAGRALGTRDTGAFGKELLNTTLDTRITTTDCGVRDGIVMSLDHDDILDRYAADAPHRNKLITPRLITTLKKQGKRQIKVRSAIKCQALDGICQKCAGLSEHGTDYPIGTHIGALAGQAISEPTMQSIMRAFHTGGAAGGQELGFKRIQQVLALPAHMKGQAPLAEMDGLVAAVNQSPGHGWDVVIDGKTYFVPQELGLGVKVGQRVKAGDKLSNEGVIHPVQLTALAGRDAGQQQLLTDLNHAYSDSGINVRQRVFETVIKPMTDKVKIMDPGDGFKHGLVEGEVVNANLIDSFNKKLKNKINVEPVLLGIKRAPFARNDFISPLMFQRLPKHLADAPALGLESDIAKGHPVTQFAFGYGDKTK